MSTREMRVANIAFLLDRLAADTPPNQQIRELTQNALEAIQRRYKSDGAFDGLIRWDVVAWVDPGDDMSQLAIKKKSLQRYAETVMRRIR